MKTVKGIEQCPACGKRIRPAHRKTPHPETAECKAAQVHQAMAARDWAQTFNVTQSKIIEESGAAFEWALGGVHQQTYAKTDDDGRVTETWTVQEQHLVGFAPRIVLRAAHLLGKVDCPPDFRRRAMKILSEHPEHIEALEAISRITGRKLTKTQIWQAVDAATRGAA